MECTCSQRHWHLSWKSEGLFSAGSFKTIHVSMPRKTTEDTVRTRREMQDVDYDQPRHFTKRKARGQWSQVTYPNWHSSSWPMGGSHQASWFTMELLPYVTFSTLNLKTYCGPTCKKTQINILSICDSKKRIRIQNISVAVFLLSFQTNKVSFFYLLSHPIFLLLLFEDMTDFLILFNLTP